MYSELKEIIGQAWENRELLREESVRQAVRQTVELVDKWELRTAQPEQRAQPPRPARRGRQPKRDRRCRCRCR